MKGPTCSVIIVSWNRRTDLEAALGSVWRQDGAESFEVLVLDNGSTDGTVEWLRSLGPKVRAFGFDTNRGSAVARNAAIRLANSSRVCFLDSDAILLDSNTIAACLAELERGDVRAVACRIWFDAEKTRPFCFGGYITPDGHFWGRRTHSETEDPHFLSTCFAVWEKSLLEELRGFDPWYFWGIEDLDLALRAYHASLRGERTGSTRFRIVEGVHVHHNMSSAGRQIHPQDFARIFNRLERQRLYQVLAYGGLLEFFRVLLRQPFRMARVERDAWEQPLSLRQRFDCLARFPLIRLLNLPRDIIQTRRDHLRSTDLPRPISDSPAKG
jgi:GT2 family glycosyltransferase